MASNDKSTGMLGTIGALAGILAGLVAVMAAIFGAFIFLEGRYVSREDPDFKLFKKEYENRLVEIIESNKVALTKEFDSIRSEAVKMQTEMTEKVDKSEAAYIAIKAHKREAEKTVNEIKEYPGKILAVSHIGGNGPNDEQDNGLLPTKKLLFEKLKNDTLLRVNYVDNTRVIGANMGCRWTVKLDENSCGDVKLYADRHDANSSNVHSNTSITGYCSDISSGKHEVTVHVSPVPGKEGANCYTGWNNSAWLIEVMEIIK